MQGEEQTNVPGQQSQAVVDPNQAPILIQPLVCFNLCNSLD